MSRPNLTMVLGVLLLGGTVGLFGFILIGYPSEIPPSAPVVTTSGPMPLVVDVAPDSIMPNPDGVHSEGIENPSVIAASDIQPVEDQIIQIVSESETSPTTTDSAYSIESLTPMTSYSASYASSGKAVSGGLVPAGSEGFGASAISGSSGVGGTGGTGGAGGVSGKTSGGAATGGTGGAASGGTGTGGSTPSDSSGKGGSIFPNPDNSTGDSQGGTGPDIAGIRYNAKVASILKGFGGQGQQRVPLGFLGMVEDMRSQEVLTRLDENQINLVHIYASFQTLENARLDLAAAQTAGMGVLQNLPQQYLTTESPAFWDNRVSQLAVEQQLKIWYLPEETKEQDIPRLRQLSQMIREKDPQHRPIVAYLENSNSGYLRQFTDIVDAIVFGAYPIMTPWRPRADIKCRLEKAHESGQTPVFAALEALEYNGKWTRPKDIRFDGYLSLISGAQGIVWYTYAHARQNAEMMDAIFTFAEEINGPSRLGEMILTGSPVTSLAGSVINGPQLAPPASAYENQSSDLTRNYSSLQWMARRSENRLYIIAVNMAQTIGPDDDGGEASSIQARFDNLSTAAAEVEVLFENRTISMNDGSFEDHFLPLGVHVYSVDMTPKNE
jgi:hypothetical protein